MPVGFWLQWAIYFWGVVVSYHVIWNVAIGTLEHSEGIKRSIAFGAQGHDGIRIIFETDR